MNREKLKSIIESILYVYSEPISIKEIKTMIDLDLDNEEIKESMKELIKEYENKGINIIKLNKKYQFVTNENNYKYLKALLNPQKKKNLTQASLETLAIIAYKQPVTKVEIEEIRGVKCDKSISTLIENNLIFDAGRLKKIGNPIIYKTTDEFLRIFSFESIKDLPSLDIKGEIQQSIFDKK
ncbi:MAG: SMC-Scp complex subunit ScpB [Peptostreptococcaceae bacterium]|jgi:segregation and condensation protein B|nr:SMC-Scp complex subunit ScpB [Peptostreptococcaceae bacterium]